MTKAWGTASTTKDADYFGIGNLDSWDTVMLAGMNLPGRAIVTGSVGHQIDVKKCAGSDGANFTALGRDLGRVNIKLILWTQDQWEHWLNVAPKLQALAKANARTRDTPSDIHHPAVNSVGIASVYVSNVEIPQPGQQLGTVEIELKCIEFRPRAKANVTKTPKASVSRETWIQELDPGSVDKPANKKSKLTAPSKDIKP